MKAPTGTSTRDKLSGEIQQARIRLAKAESQLKSAKERARLAKRRRKEAKEAARRAKKQSRLAKRELAEAKRVLAEAEEKLVQASRTAAKAKATQKPVASSAAKSPKLDRSAAMQQKVVSGAALEAGVRKPILATSTPGKQIAAPAGQAAEGTLVGTAELAKPVEPGPDTNQTQ
ncbi:MAG: hypothetical protein NT154_07305 [Verrucomicrobia bacterium]|nr:hypothetical protein [Verrucomicrobiota bacterium]